jgi:guanine deaminase
MRMAIDLSLENVRSATGGPFGAVIVRNNQWIAASANRVTVDNDPTAHAEVSAIRLACSKLGQFHLQGCVIYTSCEPCPMCLGAIYWAHLDRIYYAADRHDAGIFDDSKIYEEVSKPASLRQIPSERILADEAKTAFREWERSGLKIEY